jgi:hypothetical protein
VRPATARRQHGAGQARPRLALAPAVNRGRLASAIPESGDARRAKEP